MEVTTFQKFLIPVLRILLGWWFFYAGFWQITQGFSAADFLAHAKSFSGFFSFFASPDMLPAVNFIVKWGHLLIGISLITGVAVRLSSSLGAILMLLYYLPRLELPFVDPQHLDWIVEYNLAYYNLVYAAILLYLGSVHAGRYFGLANWVLKLPAIEKSPVLRAIVS